MLLRSMPVGENALEDLERHETPYVLLYSRIPESAGSVQPFSPETPIEAIAERISKSAPSISPEDRQAVLRNLIVKQFVGASGPPLCLAMKGIEMMMMVNKDLPSQQGLKRFTEAEVWTAAEQLEEDNKVMIADDKTIHAIYPNINIARCR